MMTITTAIPISNATDTRLVMIIISWQHLCSFKQKVTNHFKVEFYQNTSLATLVALAPRLPACIPAPIAKYKLATRGPQNE